MEEDEYIWESRRFWRRLFIGVLVPVACIALFYAEENWRGRHAWNKFRHEIEAKGGVLDWNAYIPPEVSPDQNLFAAANMSMWFIGRGSTALSRRMDYSSLSNASYQNIITNTGRVLLAEIKVVSQSDSTSQSTEKVFRANDAGSKAQVDEWTQSLISTNFIGAMGFTFVTRPLQQLQPGHAVIQSDKPMTVAELAALFPTNPVPAFMTVPPKLIGGVTVEESGSNGFRVWLKPSPYYTAAEFIEWTDGLQADFEVISEAVQRPCTRMDGNYQEPISQPIPNFVTLRTLAQVLSVRAQCQLVQGRPEEALKDLTLLHNLSRILIPRPSARPVTLVAAMINVAITGLYAQTVADGFRFHAWQQPQMAALQEQLAEISLPPQLLESFETERAAMCQTLSTIPLKELMSPVFQSRGGPPPPTMTPMENFRMLRYSFVPGGWVYQNMVFAGGALQGTINGFGLTNGIITPARGMREMDSVVSKLGRFSPNSFLASMFVPNYSRAVQTLACTQTRVSEGYLACALERFRSARGSYPATLAELMPQFAKEIPRDIIGGEALRYRRIDENNYLLYSIGWNEKDEGGLVALTLGGTPSPDLAKGDWVWPPPPLR